MTMSAPRNGAYIHLPSLPATATVTVIHGVVGHYFSCVYGRFYVVFYISRALVTRQSSSHLFCMLLILTMYHNLVAVDGAERGA